MTWCGFWKEMIIALVPAVIVAIAAIVTLNQFYRQKWWEKRTEAYSTISKDLSSLFFCVEELCAELEGEKELVDHRRKTLDNEYLRRLDSLKITVAGGAFIISKEVYEVLGLLVKNLENNYYKEGKEPFAEYYSRNYDFIETCKNNFNVLAKKDLNIKNH